MKLTISILLCVIITLQYNGADGQLKEFSEKIHNSVHGTAKKVNNSFHSNAKKQQENQDESSYIHFVESEEDFNVAAAPRKPVEVTPAAPTSTSTLAAPTSTSTLAPSDSATTLAPSVSATTLAPSTTTKKEERVNFQGGCIDGYMRTPYPLTEDANAPFSNYYILNTYDMSR